MTAVFKREFLSYFRSPVGYVALALFSFLSGFLFINQFGSGAINLSTEIGSLRSFFVIVVPVITMGLFAEDKKRGTDILYYTSPVSLFNVVAGKFLAAMALFAVLFLNVIVHMIITACYKGVVDIGTWGSVIVFFFLASLFIAFGIFASSITDSQIIAAIISFVGILLIQLLSTISSMASSTIASFLSSSVFHLDSEKVNKVCSGIADVITWFDPFAKTREFSYGIFSLAPLFFCLSIAVFFLFLTYRVLEKKRWAQS